MSEVDGPRARVFGREAEEYHRWRLGYPAAAVDWLLPPGAAGVLDVGAGTGKLTAPLAQRGVRVTAVDPDPRMLAVLRRDLPGVPACRASAEALPVRDASVDAVLVADAWHWFAPATAIAEARRVLRPGGWLGLVWHGTDLADGWVRALADLDPGRASKAVAAPSSGLPDDEVEQASFGWTWQVGPQDVVGLLSTHSAYAVMDPDDRRRRLRIARDIVAAACAAAGTATVPWRQTTTCHRWRPGGWNNRT